MSDEQPIWFHLPPRGAVVPSAPPAPAVARVPLTIDGTPVDVPEGATLLEACRAVGKDVPTLCYLETLTPVNACRVCVVEVEGARVLAPACSRTVEAGMKVQTDSPRVRTARKVVLELLASSVDLSTADELTPMLAEYGADPSRFGPTASTVAQPLKDDNDLYVRDYSKCVLCYKCVEACGTDAQNTFAIAVAGRGFHAHISTELDVPLPESACVYCGNCIAVCPTGALMAKPEFELRQAGNWAPERQTAIDTICPYCGVGCTLTTHVQDDRIVTVTSPFENGVTQGNLCVKGRFGFEYVNEQGAGTNGSRERGTGSRERLAASTQPRPSSREPMTLLTLSSSRCCSGPSRSRRRRQRALPLRRPASGGLSRRQPQPQLLAARLDHARQRSEARGGVGTRFASLRSEARVQERGGATQAAACPSGPMARARASWS